MILSEKQQKGLEIAVARYKAGERFTVISGYAGSGKSTLVKFLVEALGFGNDQDQVGYATPTGKAAQVLVRKGHSNATTIHKLLYEWKPKPNGTFFRMRKYPLPKLVICDEVSMISREMVEELLRHRETHVIFCGDPAQIPPIKDSDDNHLLDNPHVFLDEVHRQALGSDIIKLSMEIREGQPLYCFKGADAQVYNNWELSDGMLTWADQIITATNKARQEINSKVLSLLGFETPYDEGVKIICGKNNWNILSEGGEPVVNGLIGTIENPRIEWVDLRCFNIQPYEAIRCDLRTEYDDVFCNLLFDKQELETGEPVVADPRVIYKINKAYSSQDMESPLPLNANLGYAITCHRAQGSQWDKVLVIEENFPFKPEEHKRWVYTAATRPESRLVIVRK